MRSFLQALFATAAIVSATGTKCAQNDIDELVSRTTCGCSKSISECLSANVDLKRLEDIEECFIGGGCSKADATVGAVWFARDCNEETGADDKEDLKKRADSSTDTPSSTNAKTTAKTTTKTTGKTTAKTTEATTTSEPSSTAAQTTFDSTSASAAASSTTATPSSTTTTDSTTSTSSTDSSTQTTAGSTTGTLVCSVTSMKSTSACSIHGGTTVTCIPTMTAIASCAPGLLCFSATAGANSCMKKNDTLTTSGLAVTIAFAVGIGSALLSWAIVGLRARNRRRHSEQVRQMMSSSGKGRATSDVEAVSSFSRSRNQAMNSEAALPLITPPQSYGQQEGYLEQQGSGGNSLTPMGREGQAAPKLHPGLGALGQETRYQ